LSLGEDSPERQGGTRELAIPDGELFARESAGDGVCRLRVATDRDPYMGPRWVDGFTQALDDLGRDDRISAVVLEGGERTFSAGASRDALLAAGRVGEGAITEYASRAARALLRLPVPVVAALAGHALGGGLVLGLWCDGQVLAAESLYGANFMALGLTPGMGATHAVPAAFGATLGREMLLTGRLLTGRDIRAAACPLSYAVRPRNEVGAAALALAREFAAVPRPALVLLKETLARPRQEALERALAAEHADHARLFSAAETALEIAGRYPAPPGAAP
jgi:polyketide biosynthesis enoyl-CoA hydratase PksI